LNWFVFHLKILPVFYFVVGRVPTWS